MGRHNSRTKIYLLQITDAKGFKAYYNKNSFLMAQKELENKFDLVIHARQIPSTRGKQKESVQEIGR
jgi:hypothetical protein